MASATSIALTTGATDASSWLLGLIGGLDWWKRDRYPTEGLAAQCDAPVHGDCGCTGTASTLVGEA